MPKHLFFDLDKTLTMSRTPMDAAHQELFAKLLETKDLVVVTGGNAKQVRHQITSRFEGLYFTLAQSGNEALNKDGTVLWLESFTERQNTAVMSFIEALKNYFKIAVKDENDIVEHRGAQISYSVIGFHEDIAKKYAFDPDDSKRAGALRALPQELAELHKCGVEVVPAGTTTYNFILKGKHKGFNIARFIKKEGWLAQDCLYVGDALFPGGNDETVIGVIPTRLVKNPDETFDFIATMLD